MKFRRFSENPVIPRKPGSFHAIHVANPDILLFRDKYHLYFRGQAEAGHDQIGVAYAEMSSFDGVHWEMYRGNPIICVSQDPAGFDSGHILDPAAIEHAGSVYLYYSSHNIAWKTADVPSCIGLAISADGTHFEKSTDNPIVAGTAPEVLQYNGRIHLFYQKKHSNGYFEIYCIQSPDGTTFEEPAVKVFGPSKQHGAFDQFSISTVRIWQEGDWFYMMYGGCPRFFDYPIAIGLARSRDLLHWQRYPGSPILERGAPGSWDEGALWFATVLKKDQTYYLWYEGTGAGQGLESEENRQVSVLCREQDYGGYAVSSFSQIGLATFTGEIPDW